MPPIQTAIRAAQDNIHKYVSADRDPVMYNISVALLNIAKSLKRLESDVSDLQRRVK